MIRKRKLLSIHETSERMGLKPETLRKRRYLKKPPRFFKVGSKIMYDQKDVYNYVNLCLKKTKPTKRSWLRRIFG